MQVVVSSQLPGRMRISIAGMQGYPVRAMHLQNSLQAMSGVHKVTCSAFTGRALVYFDERILSAAEILQAMVRWTSVADAHENSTQELVASTLESGVNSNTRSLLQTHGASQKAGRMKSANRSGPGVTGNRLSNELYHALGDEEVLRHVGARLQGLTRDEVLERVKLWGRNELRPPVAPSSLHTFLGQFKDLSTVILLCAAGLSLFTGETFSAMAMVVILIVNAGVATWQQVRAAAVLEALKTEDRSTAKVIREGTEEIVAAKELVPGDIVLVEPGDIIPADLRVLESWHVEVNEAMLTGESVPVHKAAGKLDPHIGVAERSNILFMGTVVTRGRAMGVVVQTGHSTEIGKVQELLREEGEQPTFLHDRVGEIGKRFVTGALVAACLVAVVGLMRGIPPIELLISTITLAASAIPEGLPLTITIALTAGILRMSKRKAVVKKLDNLEALGRVTVICSDKTGTLTRNEMTVKELVTVGRKFTVTGEGYSPEGTFHALEENTQREDSPLNDQDLRQLLMVGILCNNAWTETGESSCHAGDPTELAVLTVGKKGGLSNHEWKRVHEIPFDSEAQSMSVVCEQDEQTNVVCFEGMDSTRCSIFTKGAPEVVIEKCTHYLANGRVQAMNDEVRQRVEHDNRALASKALRVLGFAFKPIQDHEDPKESGDEALIYVGLMGMIDPPKDEVATSIEEARALGIKPVMITGDHPLTARAIGIQLGIYHSGDRIVTGADLERLSKHELDTLIAKTSIFARVSPEHKLRIVEAYQRNGHVVAMTGDGVNDAPAILRADVGIAMGAKGTDITKGTAGIVLTEDHFHSILDGIKEGRTIIGNIRKAIGCLLAGNLAEVMVTALSVLIGLPIPFIPLQILLMNVLTDAIPAMVLATESRDNGVTRPYQDVVDKPLYQAVMVRGAVLGLGALMVFGTALAMGMPLVLAQTMTFTSLVVGQLIHITSWRKYESSGTTELKRDRPLLIALGASALTLAAVIYIPALQRVFSTVPLGPWQWAIILGADITLMKLSDLWLNRRIARATRGGLAQALTA